MKNKRYITVNLILFAILYLTNAFNDAFIRPVYGQSPVIGVLSGSFPNFMAAWIISLFSLAPILARKIDIKKARAIFYTVTLLVFLILTVEEIRPMWGASETYDLYDIIANGLGMLIAIFTFELMMRWRQKSLSI